MTRRELQHLERLRDRLAVLDARIVSKVKSHYREEEAEAAALRWAIGRLTETATPDSSREFPFVGI